MAIAAASLTSRPSLQFAHVHETKIRADKRFKLSFSTITFNE
jgi:hypothetical protein